MPTFGLNFCLLCKYKCVILHYTVFECVNKIGQMVHFFLLLLKHILEFPFVELKFYLKGTIFIYKKLKRGE